MPQTQQQFSEWAKTYSSRIQPTPVNVWQSNDGFLWKVIVLIGLTYLVWSDKLSFTLFPGKEAQETHAPARTRLAMVGDSPRRTVKNKSPKLPAKTQALGELSDSKEARSAFYINRFAPVAVAEMRKYGIPASIILAQGLVESNAGASTLAAQANNHFGIKCFSRHCKSGHCVNHKDDTAKDYFVKYNNAWSSFRAHSEFLKKAQRYQHLFKSRNYKTWANGLERAGYATDKKYAEKLIAVIIRYDLQKYDTNI